LVRYFIYYPTRANAKYIETGLGMLAYKVGAGHSYREYPCHALSIAMPIALGLREMAASLVIYMAQSPPGISQHRLPTKLGLVPIPVSNET